MTVFKNEKKIYSIHQVIQFGFRIWNFLSCDINKGTLFKTYLGEDDDLVIGG